jgi:hypothetical protein
MTMGKEGLVMMARKGVYVTPVFLQHVKNHKKFELLKFTTN